jgi:hypothetical protein
MSSSQRNRLSVDDRIFRDQEREPSLIGSTARARQSNINRPAVSERINGSRMVCCDSPTCVCVCPDCGKDSITGVRCEACGIAHDLTVQRERRESIKQALWLEMQLGAL